MKTKITLLALLLSFINVEAQTNIFSENMGTPSATTIISSNTFQNSTSLTYSNGGQPGSANVRNTFASSGYSGYSAGGNTYFTSSTTQASYGFSIEGINASNYSSLTLQFGYRKELQATHATFSVDYWNGSSWTTLANTASALFNEVSTYSAGWYLSKSLSLPIDAQINGLKIRFVKSGSYSIRIDDVKLTGIEVPPSISTTAVTSISDNSATFGGNVTATGGSNITATGTVFANTITNANPTIGGSGVTVVASASPNAGTGSFTNALGAVLSPNIQYSYTAYATKSTGLTAYGTVDTFYTLAVAPTTPSVTNPTGTSLKLTLGNTTNSAITTYSIYETTTANYVQADGTLGTTEVFQTANAWGNKTVIGLSQTTTYTFQVRAKNGDGIVTAYSSTASGTTLLLPVISVTGTITPLSTTYGTASSFSSFMVSGINLTDNITITVPTGFEISVTNNGLSGYASSQTLNQISGTVSSTTVYVRLAATTGFGTYPGNVVLASINDGLTVNVDTNSGTVSKLTVNITGVSALDKPYDGNTNATISGYPFLNGILSSDDNFITLNESNVIAVFSDASIGIGKAVVVIGYELTGSASGNYELIQPIGLTASITGSGSSDMIINTGSSTNDNSNINYKIYQGTQLSNTGTGANGSIGMMGFYLRDGGEEPDADSLPTELTSLSLQIVNPQFVRAVRLFVGTSPRGESVMVNGESIVHLNGLTNLIAPDNGQLAINLRVTFNSEVVDNEQVIFIVNGATANPAGSTFASPDGGGINSVSDGDVNRIEVIGQQMKFVQQPPTGVTLNSVMTPPPTMVVKDEIGNIDLDFHYSIFVMSSGTTSPIVSLPTAFTNGVYTFDNIIHTVAGSNLHLGAGSLYLTGENSTLFTVGAIGTPYFSPINPICEGGSFNLPLTSENGFIGSWSPPINNTQTTTYTFTPNPGQDATTTTLTVTVNPNALPTFYPIPPINAGNTLSALPTTSINGITGSWSPSLDNSQTTTYTFTPDSIFCADIVTLTIEVFDSTTIVPTFNSIEPICVDTPISQLPTTSTNGIVGVWNPSLNLTTTTTYTFTPNEGQNSVNTILTIVVNPKTLPTFTPVTMINYGDILNPNILPTISLNGITGTWSPELNNTITTTYVFMPTDGLCATSTTLTIVVQQPPSEPIYPSETTVVTNPDGSTEIVDAPICLTDTKGELSVSSAGTPIYKVPIALPPGIKDVAPQLSLEYSGSSVQGIAGMGWNLKGISSIIRVSSRLDLDGVIDPVDFDYLDRYVLDGQRLIAPPQYYGLAGTQYQTENYSNLKIESAGNFSSVAGQSGPQSFTVTFPDGSQAFYGGTYDSRGLSEWKINRWIDPQGNYVDYSYFTENYVTQINKITWGRNINSSVQYTNVIEFSYKNRLRPEYSYMLGNEVAAKKILSHITVKTGGEVFRTYTLGHENRVGNYQRVKYVIESNGNNSVSNPIYFEYNNTTNELSDFVESGSITGSEISKVKTSGDFDGDGNVDFVANDKVYMNPIGNNNNWYGINLNVDADHYLPVSVLENNKLNQFQSVLSIEEKVQNNIYKVYSYDRNANQMLLKNTLTSGNFDFSICQTNNGLPLICDIELPDQDDVKSNFLEGDYNGDGITEIIHIRPLVNKITQVVSVPYLNTTTTTTHLVTEHKTFFLNLKDNLLTENNNLLALIGQANFSADFNGDGKTDILSVNKQNDSYKVFQYNIQTGQLEILFTGTFTEHIMAGNKVKQIVIGDFNGDSKMDLMIPLQNGNSSWVLRLSTGISFKYDLYSNFELYQPVWRGAPSESRQRIRTYRAADLNKDGKSDFITSEWESWNVGGLNNRNSRGHFKYKENVGSLNTKPFFLPNQTKQVYSIYGDEITCLVGDFKNPQANFQFTLIQKGKIWKGQYGKDFEAESRLTKVWEVKKKIFTDISYKSLVPTSGLGTVDDVYHSSNSENYPFTEMISIPSMKVVDRVMVYDVQTETHKSQLYKYYGLVIHSGGNGIIGFKKMAKSSWFNAGNTNKIWSCYQMNPQILGQKVYEWSYSGDDHASFNTPPLGVPSETDLGITSITYNTSFLGSGVKIIMPNKVIKRDFLTDLVNQTELFYDDYWNVERTLYTNAVGTKEVVNLLYNNVSGSASNYAVGRITQIDETLSNYNDTYTSQQKFEYHPTQVNLVKKYLIKGHNTDFKTEEYEYDVFGNVKQKSVSSSGVSTRIIKDKYDISGRFVIEKTDLEGFVTKFEYNNLGQVTKLTSPLNVVTVSNYNGWGLLTGLTTTGASSSAQKAIINYSRDSNGDFIKTTTNPITNDVSRNFLNRLGQKIKSSTKGFASNTWISQDVEYDFLGRKYKESEPYLDSNSDSGTVGGSKWNIIRYDYLSRPYEQEFYNGKILTTVYDGLTTITTDGPRISEVTVDANGQKRVVKDNGEEINFNYYASGLLKETVYGNHTVSYNYNGWGMNTYMHDPSIGTLGYTNDYNNYGELLTATTPTGTTLIEYSPTGRILQKTSTGQNTNNSQSVYGYDAQGRMISETGSYNGKAFSYINTYNSLSQLICKKEITPDNLTHIKQVSYDGQGRVFQENSNSFITNNPNVNNGNVTIEYGYSTYNGMLEQYKNVSDGTILWKRNSVNEKMQTLSASFGNGIQITNVFDEDYYIKKVDHTDGMNVALNLEYEFERERGILEYRKNILPGLTWEEEFEYDDFERLISWTDPTGNSSNSYESDGRISSNNAVGTYNYGGASRYRRTTADLNANGDALYLTRCPQTISYNMFKNPVSISEVTRGDVTFEYNTSNTRSKASIFAVNGTITKNKFYSGISEVEIVEKPNQTLQFVTYLGGSTYDALVALEKTYTVSGSSYTESSQEFLYLHRDYQSTILAISGDDGVVKERRLFDPWGNVKKKFIGNSSVPDVTLSSIDFELLTDRGYTGHEHFFSVGIIHMNARIYDPVLRNFFSADALISNPNDSQNYNRYAYALNNPLKYVDYDGNEAVAAATITVTSAIIIGAIVGGVTYGAMAFYTGSFSWGGLAKSIVVGAASGAASFGVGEVITSLNTSICAATQTLTQTQITLMLNAPQALMHGIAQGFIQGVSGGDARQSFITASISSVAAGGYGMLGGSFAQSGVGQVLFGTFAGGATASLVGGNFWEGAVTGMVVSLLNHYGHKRPDINKALAQAGIDNPDEQAPISYASIKRVLKSRSIYREYQGAHLPTIGDGEQLSIDFLNDYIINEVTGEPAHAVTNLDNGNIVLGRSSFANWRQLGRVLIHEFSHRYHYVHGYVKKWYGLKGITQAEVIEISEYFSWGRSVYWGESPLGTFSPYANTIKKYHLSSHGAW